MWVSLHVHPHLPCYVPTCTLRTVLATNLRDHPLPASFFPNTAHLGPRDPCHLLIQQAHLLLVGKGRHSGVQGGMWRAWVLGWWGLHPHCCHECRARTRWCTVTVLWCFLISIAHIQYMRNSTFLDKLIVQTLTVHVTEHATYICRLLRFSFISLYTLFTVPIWELVCNAMMSVNTMMHCWDWANMSCNCIV